MIFLKEKIYQNEIVCFYDSSPSVWVWVSVFYFSLHFSVVLAVTLPSRSTHLLTVVPTYWEFRTVYICRCFRFTIFMTFKICILCINEQNVYKTFQGKTISGGDNKAWYLIRISEKIILIDIKDKLVEGKRTGLKTQRCSMFEFESYSDLIFFSFYLWVVWWVGSCFSYVARVLNLFILFETFKRLIMYALI